MAEHKNRFSIPRPAEVRRRAGSVLMNAFFRGLSSGGKLHPLADLARHDVEVITNVAYQPQAEHGLTLDIYRPTRGEGPWPVVFYVHGGGFQILSKDTHWLMGLAFARRGYIVCNIDYRLGRDHRFPEGLIDVCEAYRWTVGNIDKFGGDPQKMILAGESAGANLVSSLAIATCYRRKEPWAEKIFDLESVPTAVLPACGVLQVSDIGRLGRRRPISRFVLDRLHEVELQYRPEGGVEAETLDFMDPLAVFERDRKPDRPLPPFCAVVGTRDPLLDDTRRLGAAMDRQGVRCDLHYFPGELHAFHAFVWRPAARKAWEAQFEFLDDVLGQMDA
jgi:acetyl esterase